MEKFKNTYIVLATFAIIVLFNLRFCQDRAFIGHKDNIIRVDTTITQNIIMPKDTIYKYVFTKSRQVRDSIYIHDTIPIDSNLCDYIRIYRDTIEDENIILYTADSIQGKYLGGEFDYKLKVPIEIDRIMTITKMLRPKFAIDLGAIYDIKQNELMPFIGVKVNKWNLLGGYNLINKSYNIGISRTLYFK